MVLKQMTMHGKGTLVQRLLAYRLIRQLCIIGLVAAVLLLTVWWHFSSAVSHITLVPTPVVKPSVAAEVSPPVTPAPTVTQLQVSGQQTPPAAVKTQLEVNGQSVPVPANGTVQETIQSPDGNTSVHLSIDATSTGSKSTSSSTHIQMNSSSHSQVVTNETH